MNINVFRHEFRIRPGIQIGEGIIVFKEGLVYDLESNKNVASFKKLDDVFDLVVKGKTIKEYVELLTMSDLMLELDGGRGSDSSGESTFKFDHASDNGNGEDMTRRDLPARLNVKVSNAEKNPDQVLKAFAALHALDDYESGATVDEQGFVTSYIHGNASSVRISGGKGEMVYHNHPSGGAFSDSDLINTSTSPAKGIVASGKNGDYIFVKTSHFQANSFVRAVRGAQMKGKNYDDAADKWLRKNRKKYGYVYEFRKESRS